MRADLMVLIAFPKLLSNLNTFDAVLLIVQKFDKQIIKQHPDISKRFKIFWVLWWLTAKIPI